MIVPDRTIHYGPINPELSKSIFIRQGIVENQYISPGLFWKENQKLIREIEDLEHKSRRRDMLINDYVLFEFYDETINENVSNAAVFEHWRKGV